MQILWQNHDNNHIFLNIAPGLGKTKLILASAAYLVQQTSIPVFVLNTNKTLSDRDFEQAKFPLEKLSVPCSSVISHGAMITFATTQELVNQNNQLPLSYHIILDEYQNVFFNQTILAILDFLRKATTFTGFSGSPINSIQLKLLENSFNSEALVFQLTPSTNIESHEIKICQTQTQHIKELSRISQKFRFEVPQVFILDPSSTTAFMKGKKKLPYVSLIYQSPEIVNHTLQELFNVPRNDGAYGTYIINEEMGTGTDFKTSADIEDRGGLVLVYGTKITNTSTFEQLSCRVGRIFNKSRRFYIIQDPNYVGSDQCYIKFQLKIAQQKEDKDARELLCKLKYKFPLCKEDIDDNVLNVVPADKQYEGQDEAVHKTNIKEECKYCENTHKKGYLCKAAIGKGQLATLTKDTNTHQMNQEQPLATGTALQLNITNENTAYAQQKHIPQDSLPKKQNDLLKKRSATTETSQLEQQVKEKIVKVPANSKTCKKERVCDWQKLSNEDIANLDQRSSEVKVNIFEALENDETQLQKRQKVTKETELMEQKTSKSSRTQIQRVQVGVSKNKTQRELIDKGYFRNYSNPSIHKEMLNDKVRVDMYYKAIESSCRGKSVLDLGCGSGILSAFAIQSGAEQVFAVDNADVQKIMAKKLKEMGIVSQKIKYFINLIENLTSDEVPQVDVIVSEWMGYFLLFENMVGSYMHAIQKFLKPEGIMIPSQSTMLLHAAKYDTTSNKIGKKHLSGDYKFAMIAQCKNEDLVQDDPVIIKQLDFTDRNLKNPLDKGFSSEFQITASKDGCFNAFVGSFEVKLCEGVFFHTMPCGKETHWKQSLFFIDNPIEVSEGEIIEGTIKVGADPDNYRNLIIKLTYKVEGKGGSQVEEVFSFE